MRANFLVVVLVSMPPLAQVSNYVGARPSAVSCAHTIVVAPTITPEIVGGVDQEDLTKAANSLATAVASKLKGAEILQPAEIARIEECDSKVVVVRLKGYHTEPARMGQNRGFISVELFSFDSPKSQTPTETKNFEASGAVHWGDSTPFENAVKSVVSRIRKTL